MKKPSISLSAVVSVISQKMTMRKLPTAIFTASALSIAIISSGCSRPEPVEQNAPKYGLVTADVANEDIGTYVLPQDTSILDESNADEIFYGKRLLPEHVGTQMNCNSCHISQGKIPIPKVYGVMATCSVIKMPSMSLNFLPINRVLTLLAK